MNIYTDVRGHGGIDFKSSTLDLLKPHTMEQKNQFCTQSDLDKCKAGWEQHQRNDQGFEMARIKVKDGDGRKSGRLRAGVTYFGSEEPQSPRKKKKISKEQRKRSNPQGKNQYSASAISVNSPATIPHSRKPMSFDNLDPTSPGYWAQLNSNVVDTGDMGQVLAVGLGYFMNQSSVAHLINVFRHRIKLYPGLFTAYLLVINVVHHVKLMNCCC